MGDGDNEPVLAGHATHGPVDEPVAAASAGPDDAGQLAADEHGAEPIGRLLPRQRPTRGIERSDWAVPHLHGAVRPRQRPVGRGRPPGRWC